MQQTMISAEMRENPGVRAKLSAFRAGGRIPRASSSVANAATASASWGSSGGAGSAYPYPGARGP